MSTAPKGGQTVDFSRERPYFSRACLSQWRRQGKGRTQAVLITRAFTFHAAHNLMHYRGGPEPLHGHTFRLEVTLEGEPRPPEYMVVDFVEMGRIVNERVVERLDHAYLNDLVEQATAEHMALWIWQELDGRFEGGSLHEIRFYETPDNYVAYRGPRASSPGTLPERG